MGVYAILVAAIHILIKSLLGHVVRVPELPVIVL
jgi:hypothetical protein